VDVLADVVDGQTLDREIDVVSESVREHEAEIAVMWGIDPIDVDRRSCSGGTTQGFLRD
jgi:hypothetical protein